MSFFEIILLGVALSMDAFAVSVCKGMACRKVRLSHMVSAGIWFGGFQMLMPLAGYFLGNSFTDYIDKLDHWIAFILLAGIGLNMIRESLQGKETEENDSFAPMTMFLMAVATSIDAFAVGLTLAFLEVGIWKAAIIIGMTTFVFSASGVGIGNEFGKLFKNRAEMAGGVILIIIGLRILLTHLGIIGQS